jgi:hypothetical protein
VVQFSFGLCFVPRVLDSLLFLSRHGTNFFRRECKFSFSLALRARLIQLSFAPHPSVCPSCCRAREFLIRLCFAAATRPTLFQRSNFSSCSRCTLVPCSVPPTFVGARMPEPVLFHFSNSVVRDSGRELPLACPCTLVIAYRCLRISFLLARDCLVLFYFLVAYLNFLHTRDGRTQSQEPKLFLTCVLRSWEPYSCLTPYSLALAID